MGTFVFVDYDGVRWGAMTRIVSAQDGRRHEAVDFASETGDRRTWEGVVARAETWITLTGPAWRALLEQSIPIRLLE